MIKCCICGKTCEGLGNNPYGAEYKVGRSFGYEERCCDECNYNYVIPGRLAKLKNKENN